MARFYGEVGYCLTEEVQDGVWKPKVEQRKYYGDMTRVAKRNEQGQSINDNITLNNSISIIADAYAYENFFAIQYVKVMGTAWKVTSVEVQRPRLILTLGGVWNGETP